VPGDLLIGLLLQPKHGIAMSQLLTVALAQYPSGRDCEQIVGPQPHRLRLFLRAIKKEGGGPTLINCLDHVERKGGSNPH
jgi:hypothetical protein